jgi:putative transposase
MYKWPHAPSHLVKGAGTYMVTGSTLYKELLFLGKEKLDLLTSSLLDYSEEFGWKLQAWAVFPNHYHFIAYNQAEAADPQPLVKKLHANTARELNKLDGKQGRKVWYQYRDTRLTFEKSYFARMHYVILNPVKHGLVKNAETYEWCSASWFRTRADMALIETVESFKVDKLNVDDDF